MIGLRPTDPPMIVHPTATQKSSWSLQTWFPSHITETISPRLRAVISVSGESQRKKGIITVRRDDGRGGGESDRWGWGVGGLGTLMPLGPVHY